MSNAAGRSSAPSPGVIYSYAGDDRGVLAGRPLRGLAALRRRHRVASSALITGIRDDAAASAAPACVSRSEEGDGGRTTTTTTTIEMPPFEPATARPTAT